MNYRHITFAVAFVFGSMAAPASAEPRAVVELFTSQGCSSCPAADKLLGELSRDPSLMTMSLAGDYWERRAAGIAAPVRLPLRAMQFW